MGVRLYKQDIAFQPDPDLIRSLRPNVKRTIYAHDTLEVLKKLPAELPAEQFDIGEDYTNNIGFRMKDDVGEKKTGEKRILFLGDSFVEADGVSNDERFYSLVQQSLNAAGQSGWRIINGAIQNGSPAQYILQLRKYLPALKPDVVILFLSPNDLADDFNFEDQFGFVFDNQNLPLRPKSQSKLWLLQKFWALRYLDVLAGREFPRLHNVLWPEYLKGQASPDWVKFLCSRDEYADDWFQKKTGHYIDGIKKMVNDAGAEIGVYLVNYMHIFDNEPIYKFQINTLNLDAAIKKECAGNGGRSYRDYVYDFLKSRGIWFGDSYESFLAEKTKDPRKKLFYYYDYHFSPAGHRVMARAVMDFLAEKIK
ncbi:MAG: Lipolytic enzyme, G-D-S-L family [Candidatus Jorgensenbacteria bacterium GW2011_GWA1_48_11]|uniref:Lipolytic enzyme, G-D-S-L family n=1 Tax=Candidatus Jorgensenbacteria bacterium GW2011_GWA1_48_11 TaxID=1618660 RepID=A0A0G1WMC0_9BACT|nr:MAG: Lipolytic enzyme, G-D-S-L family [Candidatus Jorgensenbacteria bacterium GW2011_GWA1_48_11]KKW11976.1 MAG: Lipolytic enzyme, G-D-S-L family [Candidatus Jorgensenbacteria bacterium GW2011_GWB1_49_9]